ncbi:MAG: hypothetical protein HUU41_07745 [Bryobacteraceae bacterium]|nr:hypothetical protein [Bryobacterales bacterium]MEB2363426.1 hypothetical protein [Bryobacterales bacterium]NUN00992.1 hypothetical protein [Bryobacteraceae bacterium]
MPHRRFRLPHHHTPTLPVYALTFQTAYYLNGHHLIERELICKKIGFRKSDNAFLAIDDPNALQAAADRLSRFFSYSPPENLKEKILTP